MQIVESVKAEPSTITISNQPRGNETNVGKLKGRNLQSLGLKYVLIAYEGQLAELTM